MNESNQPKEQRDAGELLKNEALSRRPEFSQSLHERLCAAIREKAADSVHPPEIRPASASRSYRSFAVTAAACLVVAAAGLLWWSHESRPQAGSSPEGPNPLITLADAAGQTTVDAGMAAENALAANRWGRLDQDAKTAAKMLFDNLPLDMLARKKTR